MTEQMSRWLSVAVAVLACLATGACGDADIDAATASGGEPPPPAADGEEAAEPESSTADAESAEATSTEDPDRELQLSHERWYARENDTGGLGLRWFAFVHNVSDAVVEVVLEVEAVDGDGATLGQSGPQPFLEFILPGERLPVGLAGPLRGEPADVRPLLNTRTVAGFKQERYGDVRLSGDVREFEVTEDEILVEAEITNTGDGPGQALFYLAAFDADGEVVAAGPGGWILPAIAAGESQMIEGSLGRDPFVDMTVERVEIHFPATESGDAG